MQLAATKTFLKGTYIYTTFRCFCGLPSIYVFLHPSPLLHLCVDVLDQGPFLFLCSFLWDPSKSRSKLGRPVYDHCRPHVDAWRPTHNFTFMISLCLSRSKALGKEVVSHADRLVVKLFCVILLGQVLWRNGQQKIFFSEIWINTRLFSCRGH